MKTKTVYSFGPDRIYIGPVTLDESDLSPADEEAVWLIPGNCLEMPPPPAVEGKRYFAAVNGMWIEEDVPVPAPTPEPSGPPEPPADAPAPDPTPHEPTFEERAAALRAGVQKHLDFAAVARGYDDMRTAVTYADEPAVPRFQAEGRAFRAWRSRVWAFCYALQEQVAAGVVDEPTLEQLLPMLPVCDFIAHGVDAEQMPLTGEASVE